MGQALSRSEAREVAFRMLFAGRPQPEVWEMALDGKTAPVPEKQYIETVVQFAWEQQALIDQKITQNLKNWTLERLALTDLAALRLAVAEMLLGKVPVPVIINEAVALAKKYGNAHSGAFVNGLLAQIAG